jgi:hypothetical protein
VSVCTCHRDRRCGLLLTLVSTCRCSAGEDALSSNLSVMHINEAFVRLAVLFGPEYVLVVQSLRLFVGGTDACSVCVQVVDAVRAVDVIGRRCRLSGSAVGVFAVDVRPSTRAAGVAQGSREEGRCVKCVKRMPYA